MPAGRYRHRIAILENPTHADTDGAPVQSPPVTIAQPWANIRPLNGREIFRFQQAQVELSLVFELAEYMNTITENMVLSYDGRTFDIEVVEHDEMKRAHTTLYCLEIR